MLDIGRDISNTRLYTVTKIVEKTLANQQLSKIGNI